MWSQMSLAPGDWLPGLSGIIYLRLIKREVTNFSILHVPTVQRLVLNIVHPPPVITADSVHLYTNQVAYKCQLLIIMINVL